MTEYNIFCYSKEYNDTDSFQQARYRAFNKVVGEDRYLEIVKKVKEILPSKDLLLSDYWKQVTQEQWKQLLTIPEAADFKDGFEYISECKIESTSLSGKKVSVELDGKKYTATID